MGLCKIVHGMAVTKLAPRNKKSSRKIAPNIVDTNIVGTKKAIPVVLEEQNKVIIEGKFGKTVEPTTTEQEDIVTAGQRRINLVWESTQAVIAVSITWAIIYMAVMGLKNQELFYAFFLIVSMYFVRTNHNIIGGVGKKGDQHR